MFEVSNQIKSLEVYKFLQEAEAQAEHHPGHLGVDPHTHDIRRARQEHCEPGLSLPNPNFNHKLLNFEYPSLQNYDIYTTFSVSAALELPADLLCIYLLDVLGRRWSAAASFALSSAFMLACSFTLNSTTGVPNLD